MRILEEGGDRSQPHGAQERRHQVLVVLQDDQDQRALPYAARGQARGDAPGSLQGLPEGDLDGVATVEEVA